MNFAKIFEIDGEQILFYLEPDSEAEKDDCEKIHQIVRIDGMCIDMAACGVAYEKADEAFAKIDEAYARNTLATARSMVNQFTTTDEE